jgi:hypothetical protein
MWLYLRLFSRNLPGETEENTSNCSQDIRSSDRDSKMVSVRLERDEPSLGHDVRR